MRPPAIPVGWAPPVDLRFGSRRLNAYQLFGAIGFVAAAAVGLLLTAARGLPLAPAMLFVAVGACVFLLLVAATKLVTGTEYIVYFHHEIAILAAGAALLRGLGVPALPYLDLAMIGILVFLGFGRIGCLMVGCCHGRPAAAGVCYGPRHVEAGFPEELAGVRLVPVQALESATALLVAGWGTALALTAAPGSALAWCVVAYGASRFFMLEPLRGDRRPSAFGLSHAQWLAAVRAAVVLVAVGAGLLPFGAATFALAAATCLGAVLLVSRRRPAGRPLAS